MSAASRPKRLFGVKDLFTTVNVLGGAVGICLCIDGRPFAAGVAVLVGYIGDLLDGWVARKLGTQNAFGAEYDTVADHLAHCIAPGAIVYTVYKAAPMGLSPSAQRILAIALGASIMVAASIRHARNAVRPVRYKGVWAGLPRTVLGFLAIGFANSALVPYIPGGYWGGVVLIPALCALTLTHLPFPSHHLPRPHHWYVRALIGSFFLTTIAVVVLRRAYIFDVLFFWMAGYTGASWMSITPEERRAYRQAVDEAKLG